jgi:xeroderma pigmentosum group C-complementing protein
MATSLELLPKNKNHCYPKDKTDLDYFQQITNWFKSTINLRNKNMYTEFKTRPPIMTSLALQMKFKAAICRRDYVLIFATILRAIGVQCRVVQSLVVAPIAPAKSQLLSLSKKPQEKPKSSSGSNSKSKSSSSSKSKRKSSSSKHSSSSKSKSKSSSSSHSKSPEKSSRSSRSKSKKTSVVIPQMDGGDDAVEGRKTRKTLKVKAPVGLKLVDESYVDIAKELPKKSNSTAVKTNTKIAPKIKFSLDSPNRNPPSPSEKLFKSSKDPAKRVREKETLKVFSPRKTRSMSRDDSPQPSTSKSAQKSTAATKKSTKPVESEKKETLQVFSPRRLRSRSRSTEEPATSSTSSSKSAANKPNLKNLNKPKDLKRVSTSKDETEAKKVKFAAGKKRPAEDDGKVAKKKAKKESFDEDSDSDSSAKYFKKPEPKPLKEKSANLSTSAAIDRRVLSSDSDDAAPAQSTSSPIKKSKGIDIWVEVYSEKDERWIAIDVMRNKVDCVKEIMKTATHPMTYVFAWNNDNSIKDVSARYCPTLNTTIRKMRVDRNYLESILLHFEGRKTVRDVKEDDELNKIQLAKPMPTSIAE